ncbi:zona pellucida sperm-binding protein 4-like [Oncorhynchus clarkii lewisi]|uniref:zona pellucida sperm-binding protein 4-like n=1 Tax=Oncorhynchus clarkii lewisi TaxID=490388 RepID=UPI0039B9BE86
MALQWSVVCLVAVAMLGCLCDAQLKWPYQPPQNPAQPLPPRPAEPLPQWPTQPLPQRPAEPLPQRSAQPLPQRPAQPLPQWPAQPLPQRPAQPLPQRPAQTLPQWPTQPLPQRPAEPLPQRPAQPLPQRPAQPLPQWPAQPLPQWPAQPFPQRPAQPLPQRPAQPLPQRPAQTLPQRPAQPFLQKPAQNIPQQITYTKGDTKQTCEVVDKDKVLCGLSGINAAQCQAISCCFDGRMCFYGKTVTVQCTKDGQFVVVVSRDATLPKLELDSISLLGANGAHCTPVGTTSAFAIYQFKVTECGTVVTEEPDTIVYENRMSSSYVVGNGPFGDITRDSHYDLLFQCRYTGTSVETLIIEVRTYPNPNPVVSVDAVLHVELRLANGRCLSKGCDEMQEAYTSYYTVADYPVTKVLRDPVYAEVRILGMTDPNVVLILEQCWANTNPTGERLPRWDLLVNGCPYQDDRYLTVPIRSDSSYFPPGEFFSHYKRFLFKMFTFVDPASMVPLQENVYIHCSATVCHALAGSCEQMCNRQRRDLSAQGQKKTKGDVVVSSQKVIMIDPRFYA